VSCTPANRVVRILFIFIETIFPNKNDFFAPSFLIEKPYPFKCFSTLNGYVFPHSVQLVGLQKDFDFYQKVN